MSKTRTSAAAADETTDPAAVPAVAQPAYALSTRMPVMGETVQVMAARDVLLRNMETGGYFQPGVPTPQTVTVTLLRRLQDGDLQLLA